jgi:hypothetical protein
MNDAYKGLLKGRPGEEILRKLVLPMDEKPNESMLGCLKVCLKALDENKSLDEAARIAVDWANEHKQKSAIAVANPTAPSTAAIQIPQSSQDSVEEVAQALAAHGVGDITHTMVKAAVEVADEIDVFAKGALYKAIFSEENKPNVEKALELLRQLRGEQ